MEYVYQGQNIGGFWGYFWEFFITLSATFELNSPFYAQRKTFMQWVSGESLKS